jgi:hypothetical protein
MPRFLHVKPKAPPDVIEALETGNELLDSLLIISTKFFSFFK